MYTAGTCGLVPPAVCPLQIALDIDTHYILSDITPQSFHSEIEVLIITIEGMIY